MKPFNLVIPAHAGTQAFNNFDVSEVWAPTFVGVTEEKEVAGMTEVRNAVSKTTVPIMVHEFGGDRLSLTCVTPRTCSPNAFARLLD